MRSLRNPFVVAKAARNLLSMAEVNINRLLGRELVPAHANILSLETTSLCNLDCRFCAYTKAQSPKVTMKQEMFESAVDQALELGYHAFELTPCTGDLFMDRQIISRLQYLDSHPDVESFQFFTNFSIPSAEQIEQLVALRKLKVLTISIYGHDLESFKAITQSTEKVYRRTIDNLETLYGLLDQVTGTLTFGHRVTRDAPRRPTSELTQMLERFRQRGFAVRKSKVYNNWGGMISQADVNGLWIDITSAEQTYKRGACAHLFAGGHVRSTGIVNGCACRDVESTLQIGDLNKTPLRDILSSKNPAYMQLIDEQQRGEFRPVCQSCDYYKSIYHQRSTYKQEGVGLQTLQQFKDRIDAQGTRPSDSY